MDLKKEYGADKDLQRNGIWVPFDDASILIAYAGDANPNYERAIEKHTHKHQKKLQNDKAMRRPENRKQVHEAVIAAYAESVVLDWKNLMLGGSPLEYSREMCKKIMIDFPELYAEIRDFAMDFSNFQPEDSDESDEEAEKNS